MGRVYWKVHQPSASMRCPALTSRMLPGRFSKEDIMGWCNYVPLDPAVAANGLSSLPPHQLNRHLLHAAGAPAARFLRFCQSFSCYLSAHPEHRVRDGHSLTRAFLMRQLHYVRS